MVKWGTIFLVVMLILFQLVSDPQISYWLNIIWIGFWGLLFVGFFIFVYEGKSKKKRDKEG